MLKGIIGSEILCGGMDCRGFSNMKVIQQFRAACRNMSNDAISLTGFELDEFYEDEVPEDDYNEKL